LSEPVNFKKAVLQWKNYIEALRQAGWTIIEVPSCD